MFFNQEQLDKLLIAQTELNKEYSGIGWYVDVNRLHFLTAAITEVAEFLESAPRIGVVGTDGWKWWRKTLQNDDQNIKVEVVDVLHFTLSIMLQSSVKTGQFIDPEVDTLMLSDDPFEGVLRSLAKLTISVCDKNASVIDNSKELLVNLMRVTNITPDQLFDWYWKKNALNLERIRSGYMSGEYQKHDADGNEDNRKLNLQ